MLSTPIITYRDPRYYAAIRMRVAIRDIPDALPPLHPEVVAWLKKKEITPDGPPFFHYLQMTADEQLLVEVGLPVPDAVAGDDRIIGGMFPGGDYATLIHTGDYCYLMEAHMTLDAWVEEIGRCDKETIAGEGIAFGGRTEFYRTDEQEVPDPAKWETEVSFFLPPKGSRAALFFYLPQ